MTSTTIIRVKRRLDEDPAEAFVLSYKRAKREVAVETESAVLKFTGTVDHKDDEAAAKAVRVLSTKSQCTKNFKTHSSSFQVKNRADSQSRSKENRFHILSLNRSIGVKFDENIEERVTIVDVDIESEESANQNQPSKSKEEPKYVYDLYSNDYMGDQDVDDSCLDHILSVQPIYTDLQYRSSEDSDIIDPYEEDSNDEGNWRNDYPDSDHSIDFEDMNLASKMYGMGIDDGYDLSNDSDDERYLQISGFGPGGGYDEYKAKILRDIDNIHVLDSISDDDYEDCNEACP